MKTHPDEVEGLIESIRQSILDNPPKSYSCICGGKLEMFGDETIGYLKCVECKERLLNWDYSVKYD